MSFQTSVQSQQAPAVEGDFASANPRATYDAGEAALVAGLLGVRVGRFAWADPTRTVAASYGQGSGAPSGFVHNDQQALITGYLDESGMFIRKGYGVTLHVSGDFWARNAGPGAAVSEATVFAGYSDGSINTAAPTGFAATGAIGSTFTATGAGTNLTTSAVTGLISIGDTIAGTGVPAGTTIVSQTSGTTGGAGVYVTSAATTAAAGTVTSFGNKLNVTAVGSGILAVGDAITGTGVPAGATIASQTSGATGGAGVYTLSAPATAYAASTALTGVAGIATNWKFKSNAAVGELVKISTY